MSIKVVLYEPLIPQNTGNIARLTAANNLELHLIAPLGFELSDKYLKRAGLDYWKEVSLSIHENWSAFLDQHQDSESNIFITSKKAKKCIYKTEFSENSILVFGNETSGLPDEMHERYFDNRLKIPMANSNVRSLNLANSVAIVCYEALRQIR